MNQTEPDFPTLREAIAAFDPSPRIEPNTEISVDEAFLPAGHRGVLDLRRQLVVGNRGMGKSFWTHALLSQPLRSRLAEFYRHPQLANAEVVIGFNGSSKESATAPTTDEVSSLYAGRHDPDLIWRAVLIRIASKFVADEHSGSLSDIIASLGTDPNLYSRILSQADEELGRTGKTLLVVFDALDRLGRDWESIRHLSRALLALAVGLQSFQSIRVKIFMRVDQFADQELFRFPDSSKIKNDHVDLFWRPIELYGLLLFELLRNPAAGAALETLAERENALLALPKPGAQIEPLPEAQTQLINGLAGEFMGSNKKRGRVYTWLPLHLSDAAQTCSPRSFLTAWKKAAEHSPAPSGRAVDHLGLQEGVRQASRNRLEELYEDYPWIKPSLEALRRQFVPMDREQLLQLWVDERVIDKIQEKATQESGASDKPLTPVRFLSGDEPSALLSSMRDVAVMEERANGKINVPDIYRVEAEILRKGGVAVPKRWI